MKRCTRNRLSLRVEALERREMMSADLAVCLPLNDSLPTVDASSDVLPISLDRPASADVGLQAPDPTQPLGASAEQSTDPGNALVTSEFDTRALLISAKNKYIGETEKNLHRFVSLAEAPSVVLLLGEGDGPMQHRTGVKSANDRYANLDVNYLLRQ